MKFATESELAAVVVKWLIADGWEVYQEVNAFGGTCDIVAVRGRVSWAIECKLAVNLEVIGQANRWVHRASMASIATPQKYKGEAVHQVAHKLLRMLGAGWLKVASDHVQEEIGARFTRPRDDIRDKLHEEQKSIVAAGGNRGGYWTPFKGTCREVLVIVQKAPGITMKQMVDGLKHHYKSPASARACLGDLAEKGLVPGVRLQRDGKSVTLWPVTAEDAEARRQRELSP